MRPPCISCVSPGALFRPGGDPLKPTAGPHAPCTRIVKDTARRRICVLLTNRYYIRFSVWIRPPANGDVPCGHVKSNRNQKGTPLLNPGRGTAVPLRSLPVKTGRERRRLACTSAKGRFLSAFPFEPRQRDGRPSALPASQNWEGKETPRLHQRQGEASLCIPLQRPRSAGACPPPGICSNGSVGRDPAASPTEDALILAFSHREKGNVPGGGSQEGAAPSWGVIGVSPTANTLSILPEGENRKCISLCLLCASSRPPGRPQTREG